MPESVYKVIELVGTSTESWEKAAKAAVDRAAKSLRDLRVAEVVAQDMTVEGLFATQWLCTILHTNNTLPPGLQQGRHRPVPSFPNARLISQIPPPYCSAL